MEPLMMVHEANEGHAQTNQHRGKQDGQEDRQRKSSYLVPGFVIEQVHATVAHAEPQRRQPQANQGAGRDNRTA
jgi:hypothetical protein